MNIHHVEGDVCIAPPDTGVREFPVEAGVAEAGVFARLEEVQRGVVALGTGVPAEPGRRAQTHNLTFRFRFDST